MPQVSVDDPVPDIPIANVDDPVPINNNVVRIAQYTGDQARAHAMWDAAKVKGQMLAEIVYVNNLLVHRRE